MSRDHHPCDYCGTMLDSDETEVAFAPAHCGGRVVHMTATCLVRTHQQLVQARTARDTYLGAVNEATERARRERALGDKLRVSLEDNRVLVQEMAKWILKAPVTHRDHACSRCTPGGEIVVPGFVCAWHIAEGLVAAATEGKAPS